MSKYNKFLQLLKANETYEIIAQDKICLLKNVKIIDVCNNSNYDFKTSANIAYEVKCDHASNKTNNFFIEFSGYNKPSGISISKANYYILSNTTTYYLIDIDILKNICKNKRVVNLKDGSSSGFVIPCDEIIIHSIFI